MAPEFPVNRFCLIDGLDQAIEAARKMAEEHPEPGGYDREEVWRKRRGDSGS